MPPETCRFPEVKRFDYPALEQETLAFWAERGIFAQSIDRPDAPAFTFYEGPPTANGRPGIHHVMARTVKDAFCRYKTLRGYRVLRKAGWDTHGLPVEIEVEKRLGLKSRADIEAYGIAAYNKACRESVLEYTGLWNEMTTRMGYWVDLEHPYVTFHNGYIASVWNLLKRLFDKGMLYQGYKIQWYSPGSGTVLSSHEVAQGYKEVQDASVYVRFPLVDDPDTHLLAWTTTPWTLPSNTAIAIHRDLTYAKVRLSDGSHVIVAEKRIPVLKDDGATVVETFPGATLEGKQYVQPFVDFLLANVDWYHDDQRYLVKRQLNNNDIQWAEGFVKAAKDGRITGRYDQGPEHFAHILASVWEGNGNVWSVIHADFVTDTDGTGVAHEAPAFGADDYNAVVLGAGMPLFNPIAPDGTFKQNFGEAQVEGLNFKDADRVIIRDLKRRGLLYREDSYLHNYPHDWRKGTPLMQYPVESWFVRTSAHTDRLVALNDTIRWQPEGVGRGRFGEWLKGGVDWALSRRRFWGTPLPIWVSDRDPNYIECIGSVEELKAKVGEIPQEAINPDTGDLDLHRPYVDALTWPSPDGGTMRRVPDLIDVWFDSGAMPFAQHGYLRTDAGETNGEAFREAFPADFIAEGVDQTRGWFYTLHAIATLVEDSVAFKNVVVNGLVLDAKGEKMSKSKGNTLDPFRLMTDYGADVTRWYMMSNASPWENLKFSEKALVEETRNRFFGTLANVYSFFATYANLDGYTGQDAPGGDRPELDRWVRHRLHTCIHDVQVAFEDYNPTRAARAVEGFVDDLSNWYLRRSRRRFWKSESDSDKQHAYATVFECLSNVALLMAPIAPFFAEWLWQAQRGEGTAASVHLAEFPSVDASALDADLDRRMALARTVSTLVLSLRNETRLNVRKPLAKALVILPGGTTADDLAAVEEIVRDEVNVRTLELAPPDAAFASRRAAANFRVLGKKIGPRMKAAAARIAALTSDEMDTLAATGALSLVLDDGPLEVVAEDVTLVTEGVPGWHVASEDGVTVALDTNRDPSLVAEGLMREAVFHLQQERKRQDLHVSDRVRVDYAATPVLAEALVAHEGYVRNEVLIEAFTRVSPSAEWASADFDGETFQFLLSRV